MKKIVLVIWFFAATALIFAQEYNIKGMVLSNPDKKPLSGAAITAIPKNSTHKLGAIADSKGNFTVKNLNKGSYSVKISFIGYKDFEKSISIVSKDIDLGKVYLDEEAHVTDEVEITAKMPNVEVKGDTTQFNSDAYKTQPDASAEDLVQKLPGVVVQDNKVQAQGEDVKQVLMDGKPFFGTDPMAALRNIPAEVIDKVQVYDQKSEQSQFTGFDDGETLKTMNIVTRSNMRIGQFGKAYAAYGYQDKYQAGANVNYFDKDTRLSVIAQSNNVNIQNFSIEDILGAVGSGGGGGMRRMFTGGGGPPRGGGGPMGGGSRYSGGGGIGNFLVGQQDGISKTHALGINYSDNWGESIKVTGSYFFNYNNNNSLQNLNRDYLTAADSNQVYNEIDNSSSTNVNHRFNFRFDYTIDSLNSILSTTRLTVQNNDGKSLTSGQTSLAEQLLNSSDNDYKSNLLGYNFSNDLLYRHKFNTRGRTFSSRVRVSYNDKNGDSRLNATSLYFGNLPLADTLNQKSGLLTDGLSLSYDINYTEPLWGESSLLEFEYEGSLAANSTDRKTYSLQNQSYDLLDTTLSSVMKSDYITQAAGVNYQYQDDDANLTAGASYQWSRLHNNQDFPLDLTTDRTFNNILPSVRFQYKFSKSKNLRIFYRTTTNMPSIDQLQTAIDNSNPLQLTMGNPELKESYQHNLFLNYLSVDADKSSNFFAVLGGSYSNSYIGKKTTIFDKDTVISGNQTINQGTQLTVPMNLSNYWTVRAFVNYGMPVDFIKSNFNINTSFNLAATPGLINGSKNNSNSKTLSGGLVLSSNISTDFDFTIASFSNMNYVTNSIRTDLNTQYFNQNTRLRLNLTFWDILVLQTDLAHQYYSGLGSGYNQNYLLWNAGIALKLFANNQGEIKFSVADILNQNNSIQRNITDSYIEDVQTNVLQRFFLLTFTYRLKNFGEQPQQQQQDDMPHLPPPGGFPH